MIRSSLKAGVKRLLGLSRPTSEPPPLREPTPPPFRPPEPAPDERQGESPAGEAALQVDDVQRVLDEQVRPALQADGGDIELVEVRGADVHVRLTGACHGCPGAAMTLRMGVEAALRDELPGMGNLVQV